jgi:hypothetical protein
MIETMAIVVHGIQKIKPQEHLLIKAVFNGTDSLSRTCLAGLIRENRHLIIPLCVNIFTWRFHLNNQWPLSLYGQLNAGIRMNFAQVVLPENS